MESINFNKITLIFQNAALGSLVTNVSADDPDSGRGGQVKYSMVVSGDGLLTVWL